MSGWTAGHAQIAALVERRHLEQVSGDAANGTYLLQQARQRLAGARAARSADHIVSAAPTEQTAIRPAHGIDDMTLSSAGQPAASPTSGEHIAHLEMS